MSLFEPPIVGKAFRGNITKKLLLSVPSRSIIIINHEDIDTVSAEEMIRHNIKAVINLKHSISGKVPNSGVSLLIRNRIPVFDLFLSKHTFLPQSMDVRITGDRLYEVNHDQLTFIGRLQKYTKEQCDEKEREGKRKFPVLFQQFVENSLLYMSKELTLFLEEVEKLPCFLSMKAQPVWIVARGANFFDEITYLKQYMKHAGTIIAVDGAANTLYKHELMPDYIIGDMDSISTDIQTYSSVFIAHSYMNGYSPGEERLKQLDIKPLTVSFPGLSEDLAIMLAYVSGASQIITVGCRTSVKELIEKGRKGMASTLLTRMYAGDIIHEWKCGSGILSMERYSKLAHISLHENEASIDES